MADRHPVKVLPDGGADSTGLSEFRTDDTVGVLHGGTGLSTVATSNILTGNGTSALSAESNLTFDGSTLAVTGDVIIGNGSGLTVGHSAPVAVGGTTSEFQYIGSANPDASMMLGRWSADAHGPFIQAFKSRDTTPGGSPGAAQDGDSVFRIIGNVDDGSDTLSQCGKLTLELDGTFGIDSTPGAWVFATTGASAASPTERMRITSVGSIELNNPVDATRGIHFAGDQNALITTNEAMYFNIDSDNGQTDRAFYFGHNAATTSATNLMKIQEDGKVGIGTASVDQLLHIEESSGGDKEMQFQIENTGIGDAAMTFKIAAQSYSMGVDNNAGDIFVISSSDNLEDNQAFGIDGNGVIVVKTDKASSHTFNIHNTTASNPSGMQIYFGGTSSGDETDYFYIAGDTGGTRAVNYSNGDWDNANNSYSGFSDIKLKQDVTDARGYWDDFKALRYRKYRLKEEVARDESAGTQLGLVAQEMEAEFPNLVNVSPDRAMRDVPVLDEDGNATYKLDENNEPELDSDGNRIPATEEGFVDLGTTTKSIKYSVLHGPVMATVVQELQTRLEAAEAKITALESA